MRIVVAHNFYRSDVPSGENAVVLREVEDLRSDGFDVETVFAHSDDIERSGLSGQVKAAAGPLYSRDGAAALASVIAQSRPDVLHLHNVFPLLSPHLVVVAKRAQVPVVQTIHNYRHGCVKGTYYRNNAVCTLCKDRRLPLPAVAHGCYRGGRLQSIPMVASQFIHRGNWRSIDRLIALTPFVAREMRDLGFPPDRIVIRPNTTKDPGQPGPVGERLLFIGRLTEEKGVWDLVNHWRTMGGSRPPLEILGSGPLLPRLRAVAEDSAGLFVRGAQGPDEVLAAMARAMAVVVPSRWYEAFPLAVVEAFAAGRPVIAAPGTSAASLIDDAVGWIGLDAIEGIARSEAERRGQAARRRFLERYERSVVMRQLLEVYRDASGSARGTQNAASD